MVYFARQLDLMRKKSLAKSSEPQQNVQNTKMSAKKCCHNIELSHADRILFTRIMILNICFIIIRILVSMNVISLLKIFSNSGKDRMHDGIKDGSHKELNMCLTR